MFYVKKRLEISASHRLDLDYPSKCANLHGHNWIVTSQRNSMQTVWSWTLHTLKELSRMPLTTRV